jgi:outer membrane receptor protein involved in Fe transport
MCQAAVSVAQTTGSIEGTVTDDSGSPLSGATIEAVSNSLQGTRTTKSGQDGVYRIPATPPGEYRVLARRDGFRPVQKAATVRLDATANVLFVLEPAAEEQVVVSGKAPLIDGTSTTTGTSYTSGVVDHLPVGRNYADIVRANPGVDTDQGYTDGGRFLPLTIYGATSQENQWLIDGVNTTNVWLGSQGKAMSTEFIQEIEVKTGGYQAEYGRALGGIVNAITKSGGNAFHGDAFAYYDSNGMAAAARQGPGIVQVDDSMRFDYGADLGGFVLKDSLWFFGAYNRVTLQRHTSINEGFNFLPTDLEYPFDLAQNLYSGKLTWNATPSTTIFGSVFSDQSSTSGLAGADPLRFNALRYLPRNPDPSTWYSSRYQGGADYAIHATQLFGPDVLATVQGSYHRDKSSLTATASIRYLDLTCTGGTPDNPCHAPPPFFANAVSGGFGDIPGGDNSASSRKQVSAGATFFGEAHEIKVGGDYMDGRTDEAPSISGGQIVQLRNEFGQNYFAHIFGVAGAADLTPIPVGHIRVQVLDYSAYVQDSWKAAAGLTVNVGLRWDGEKTFNDVGQEVFRSSEWQPRVGFVWDPWHDGMTKIYASAGRFSYALPTNAAIALFNSGTGVTTYNFDPVSVVPNPGVIGHPINPVVSTGGISVPEDPNLKGFSQSELLVGVERMLLPGLTVGIKGTYRRLNNAVDLRTDLDYTSPLTGYSSLAVVNPGSNEPFARGAVPTCNGFDDPYYACSITNAAMPPARRLYRGIEVLARQSVGSQLWLQASYIYSSLRGNYDGAGPDPGTSEELAGPASTWHNNYGALDLDRPHRVRLDGFWLTPWRISIGLQTFLESGAPINKMGYLNDNVGAAVFLVPRGTAGRLPTLWEANLQLAYPVVLGPVTATLQAYCYNLFNNQIATSKDEAWSFDTPPPGYPATIYDPNQPQTNPTYGQVTSRYAPRSFRAALKVSF